MAFCLISLSSAQGSVPLQEQSGFGTEHVIHPWAEKNPKQPGPGVKIMPAGTGRGWGSPVRCVLILPAGLLRCLDLLYLWGGRCLHLGWGAMGSSARYVTGKSAGTWEEVSFCLVAPDICICNPSGFPGLSNLPKCLLTALLFTCPLD